MCLPLLSSIIIILEGRTLQCVLGYPICVLGYPIVK